MNKNTLYIIRGVSESGKTFTTETLAERSIFGFKLKPYPICTADDYFVDWNGIYKFDELKLSNAHRYCFNKCETMLSSNVKKVFVNNTSTTETDVMTYIKLAKKYNYNYVVLTNETWHDNTNVHNVTDKTIKKMEYELLDSIKLHSKSKFNIRSIINTYKELYVNEYVMIGKEPKLVVSVVYDSTNNKLYFKFEDKTKHYIELNKQYNIKK